MQVGKRFCMVVALLSKPAKSVGLKVERRAKNVNGCVNHGQIILCSVPLFILFMML